ncbi:hypothetical protein QJS10_CPB19g00119 [Acorus calamus]|uniref:Uncharacterized protein n=1 Tax=Acorus calamus TaxID=4465 RepID=A0AAV9CJK1_ACOCL|nr:hypothetical protein QJS10_CPB19g00119 [Acorus calamus]
MFCGIEPISSFDVRSTDLRDGDESKSAGRGPLKLLKLRSSVLKFFIILIGIGPVKLFWFAPNHKRLFKAETLCGIAPEK